MNSDPRSIATTKPTRKQTPKAGVWDQIMEALAAAHDAAVQTIDASVVRVHGYVACIAWNAEQT